jgi:hypothetical protein
LPARRRAVSDSTWALIDAADALRTNYAAEQQPPIQVKNRGPAGDDDTVAAAGGWSGAWRR